MASNIVSDAPKKRRKSQTQHTKGSSKGSFEGDVLNKYSETGNIEMIRKANDAVYMNDDKWYSGNHRKKGRKIKHEGAIRQLSNDTY